jgi:formylglycine-generating enzyme
MESDDGHAHPAGREAELIRHRVGPATTVRSRLVACAILAVQAGMAGAASNPAGIHWVALPGLEVARTEITVGQFRRFVQATGTLTRAESSGGGEVYEAGWVRKPGWYWAAPFGGDPAKVAADEPAAHLTFFEAQAFCRWAGGRLPTDPEWTRAAYTEQRLAAPAPLQRGQTYPYPSGPTPAGAQCLDDCGDAAARRAIRHAAVLSRGHGHARAGATPPGVNGLHDMGGNLWEWVDEPPGATGSAERRTRGGSWWYGSAQMRIDHLQGKPADTAVVYIGARCVR